MATAKIIVNINTWTQVLSGAGFAYSGDEIEYNFSESSPVIDGFVVSRRIPVDGALGQILWARSVGFANAVVFSNPEA